MSIIIQANVADSVNFAATHLNRQRLVGDVVISGASDDNELVCRIITEPPITFEYREKFGVSKGQALIKAPVLKFNDAFYRQELIEAREGELKIEVLDPKSDDKILGFLNQTIHIQPYLHWDAVRFPDTMAAFMQPNDPQVQMVVKKAGEYAAAEDRMLAGYQIGGQEAVIKQAEYVYRALQDLNIHYVSAPVSFEVSGQKIRIPHLALKEETRQGTCLDLAVLYATCMESISLNAFVVVIRGHAFSGVWLKDQHFAPSMVNKADYSNEEWEKALAAILPVECTSFTDGRSIPFSGSVACGRENLKDFLYFIDVAGSRNNKIGPVYTFTDEPICKPEDPVRAERYQVSTKTKSSNLEILQDQAMDLTMSTKYLGGREDVPELHWRVSIRQIMEGKGLDSREFLADLEKSHEKRIKDYRDKLRRLFSLDKQNVREKGVSNLYLALNQLEWRKDKKKYRAPLYFCPAEIVRNKRGELLVGVKWDKMFFNPALRSLMSQWYHLDSSELSDHPKGEADYNRQMDQLRFLIENQDGWSVKENTASLSLYTMPNEAVWNSLSDPAVVGHEIVSGLLEGKMTWENEMASEITVPYDAVFAFETDSAQRRIIEAAFRRRAQVVVGPAGNGKTQTIANIIVEAIRRGQKVLFVSETGPAMDVACDKLKDALEDHFFLRVQKNSSTSGSVKRQIQRTLDYIETPRNRTYLKDAGWHKEVYSRSLKYLENYYCTLSEGAEGTTLEDLIDLYEEYADCELALCLDEEAAKIPREDADFELGAFFNALQTVRPVAGDLARFIRYEAMPADEKAETEALVQDALEGYQRLLDAANDFRIQLGLPPMKNERGLIEEMYAAAKVLCSSKEPIPVIGRPIDGAEPSGNRDEAFEEELNDLLNRMASAKVLKPRKDTAKRMLQKLGLSFHDTETILNKVLRGDGSTLEKVSRWRVYDNGDGTWTLDRSQEWADCYEQLKKRVSKAVPDKTLQDAIWTACERIMEGGGELDLAAGKALFDASKAYNRDVIPAEERIVRNINEFRAEYPQESTAILLREWLKNHNLDIDRSRLTYEKRVEKMKQLGLGTLVPQLESACKDRKVTLQEVLRGYCKAWAAYQLDRYMNEHLDDTSFDISELQFFIDRLASSQEDRRQDLRKLLAQQMLEQMPSIRDGVPNDQEFGRLQALVRGRDVPIRRFFEEVPHALTTVFPCMIMDPASVAEWIPTNFPKFDLVLIDEGSQMPVYNGVIPISRGNRCMIFGDEKQLQPTSDFKKKVEEDYAELVDRTSIITAAIVSSIPREMLLFHYRSETESLIAFSNKYFYDRRIITFPSCDTAFKGVYYQFVKDGVYAQKTTKANEKEAEQVISQIQSLYQERRPGEQETLAVITLNIHQRDMVREKLLNAFRGEELEEWVDEYVTVVNLESCQGKEWDTVIISPGFGYNEDGKMVKNFGALNRSHGENRLNVLITRARKRLYVITSIDPSMLQDVTEGGMLAFRDFLRYAKGNLNLDTRVYKSDSRPDGIAKRVADALEKRGYTVHTNIGSSAFKVDLGIVSPTDPGRYAMGILLDHTRESRDKIRDDAEALYPHILDAEVMYPRILAQKSWNIYRLSKLNWRRDPSGEIENMIQKMEVT